jgi:hypothetical protein
MGRLRVNECPKRTTDLRGPAENPDMLSCCGGFLRYFREQRRGFHDLLRQKPSSLFILLGWSSIASLMMRSMYLGLVVFRF